MGSGLQPPLSETATQPSGFRYGADACLKDIIQNLCTESRAGLLKLEVMPDPCISWWKSIRNMAFIAWYARSRVVRLGSCVKNIPRLKSRLPSLWTNAYFVSTVGGAPLEVIKQYIENQKRV